MKLVCIGTLDKFSRFYLDIKREMNKHETTKFKIYCIHISGFLYTLFRFQLSSWISLKAWFVANKNKKYYIKIINEGEYYKEIKYGMYIEFHKKLSSSICTQSLKLQSLAYIDIFDAIFSKTTVDYLICIGDTKLCIEIAVAVAKKYNTKIRYIEQGPFGATFFDQEGVNANLSARKKFKTSKTHLTHRSIASTKRTAKKYFRSPLFRLCDIFLMKLFENTKFYPPDLKYTDLNSLRLKFGKFSLLKIDNRKPIFLLILQVPQDVNMICHSPNYTSQTEIVKAVYMNLPKNSQLLVREHPLYINKYQQDLYNFIKRHQICINNDTNFNSVLEACNIVIVNNSTVGIEAIMKFKTVVVLGNAFYDSENICLKLTKKKELKTILSNALTYIPDKIKIKAFINLLFNTALIEGAIVDKNLRASKHIAKRLLNIH